MSRKLVLVLLALEAAQFSCATRLGEFQETASRAVKRELKQAEDAISDKYAAMQSLWGKFDQQAAVAMEWVMPSIGSDPYASEETYASLHNYVGDYLAYDDYLDADDAYVDDVDVDTLGTWASAEAEDDVATATAQAEVLYWQAAAAEMEAMRTMPTSDQPPASEPTVPASLPEEALAQLMLEAQSVQQALEASADDWVEAARAQEEEWLAAEAAWRDEQRRQAAEAQPAALYALAGEIPVVVDRMGRAMNLPDWATWAEVKAAYLHPLYLPDGTPDYRLLAMVLLCAASISTMAAFVLSCLELRDEQALQQGETGEHLEALLAGYVQAPKQQPPQYDQVTVNPLSGSTM